MLQSGKEMYRKSTVAQNHWLSTSQHLFKSLNFQKTIRHDFMRSLPWYRIPLRCRLHTVLLPREAEKYERTRTKELKDEAE